MIFITTACGEKHRALARRLWETWTHWGWPPLIVVSDEPIEGIPANVVADAGGLWGGRGVKTRFADYLPEGAEGMVGFVDADCTVEGEFQGVPNVPPGSLMGVRQQTYERMKGPDHFLCSAFLVFGDVGTARKVSGDWYAELVRSGNQRRDEVALFFVTKDVPKIPHGTVDYPLANLRHDLVTTLVRRGNSGQLPGWFDYADIYSRAVKSAPRGAVMVEVGVWRGKSLEFLAGHLATTQKGLTVIGYDQFLPEYYLGPPIPGLTSDGWLELVKRDMLSRVPHRPPSVIRADSVAAAGFHEDGSVHFVFLDAGHREEDLIADLSAWLPKIAAGGFIAGHDLDHPKHPGVRSALEKSGLAWEPASRSSWIARTTGT